ncbi:MAG: GTP-binding protein [Pirellulales bacterium]
MSTPSKKTRFLMIGGFLGAGKTTAIARIARHYLGQGLQVGIVTNDQAHDLVDTHALRSMGFRVGEVPGACFCCKFDDLIKTLDKLATDQRPDVVLTEPVGSCTDLVATVIRPLEQLHGRQFELGPLAVLFKPEHGRKILSGRSDVGFSPKAAYIFLKQLEEADLLVVNKVDRLDAAERHQLVQLVQDRFPDKTVVAASAVSGDGYATLLRLLDRPRRAGPGSMEVDYDLYAAGEAELGWLNATVDVAAKQPDRLQPFDLDPFVLSLVERIRVALACKRVEPVHVKILGRTDQQTAIANLVGSGARAELSVDSNARTATAHLIINARVAAAPEDLAAIIRQQVAELADEHGLDETFATLASFRPGRPVPTHRI